MKINLKNIISIFLFFVMLSSCSILKTNQKSKIEQEKNNQKFVYLFSEANKNRLLGNKEMAIEQYIACIDIKPQSAASNFYLASLFLSDKKYNSALTFADKAVELQTNNIWYNLIKADIKESQNKIEEAYNIYYQQHKKYPKNELLYERIIKLLSKKIKNEKNIKSSYNDNYKQLIEIFKDKEKNFGYEKETSLSLYDLSMTLKNKEDAENSLKTIINNEEDNAKYKALLAEFYLLNNRTDEAKKIFDTIIKQYPNDSSVKLSYATYCKYTGNKEEYYLIVKDLMNSDIKLNKKISLLISGRYPNFRKEIYEELLIILYDNHTEEIIANTLLAEFYINENKQKSIPYLIKANKLSKGDFNLLLTLFEILYDTHEFETLYKESKGYLQTYPNRPKVYLYHGISAYKLKKYDESNFVLDMGKDLVINDDKLLLQFYFYLAETYHSKKIHQKSDEEFEKVLELNPNFYLALSNYSYYLSERNVNIAKALSMAKKCIDYQPENPIFCDTYAKALYRNKDYKKALIYSEIAINKVTNNPDFFENHGDIKFANNYKDEALKFWKMSKEKGNKSKWLIYKIENINNISIDNFETEKTKYQN